jgi:2'-5' RNA ligase
MPRTFVALLLSEEARAAVAAEVDRLRPLSRAVAWVPARNLHLTLHFLGEQRE